MVQDPNLSIASATRIFLQHFGRADSDIALGLMAESVVYRVPGRSALAGTYNGRDAVSEHLGKLLALTGGTMEAAKVEDIMEGEQHVAALVDSHAQGSGRNFRGRFLFLFGFNADRLIHEVAVFACDEAAVERFFGI